MMSGNAYRISKISIIVRYLQLKHETFRAHHEKAENLMVAAHHGEKKNHRDLNPMENKTYYDDFIRK